MSSFLPESKRDVPALPPPASAPDESTRNFIHKAFSAFNQVPEAWLSGLISLLQVEQPMFDQIPGKGAYDPQFAQILTPESLTGTTAYSDLATVGPTVSNLGQGTYVAIWMAVVTFGGVPAAEAYMSLAVNGSDLSDSVSAVTPGANPANIFSFYTGALTGTTNTVKGRYRVANAADTATFSRRNLLVLRVH